jgi:hydrogenase maturation protein HypF
VLLGWALEGVGLGTDQTAWGGELLWVQDARFERLNHLPALMLPGGDVAAREPWRMAVAALHRLDWSVAGSHSLIGNAASQATIPTADGVGTQTTDWMAQLFGPHALAHLHAGPQTAIPPASLQGVRSLLQRGLHCPGTTSAGRWFDAVAGLLGVCWWQTEEAQAAIALEQLAAQWLNENTAPQLDAELVAAGLNLDMLLQRLLARMATQEINASAKTHALACHATQSEAAALFHVALADALARAAIHATQQHNVRAIALSGGCFFNRILRTRLCDALTQAGLSVHLPQGSAFGDAGLALGQAWVAAHTLHASRTLGYNTLTASSKQSTTRNTLCV